MKKLNVGILGPGTVGGGAYEILTKNKDVIEKRTGVSVEVFKLLTRRPRPEFPAELLTDDPDDILNNPDVNVVVETMGGIQPATSFMLQAMKNGKHVVTANKAAVAANYEELTGAALENEVKFLFEASVGGGIPVLTAIQNALSGNNFLEVMGIVNGTTNYILTKMTEDGADYKDVLKDAQAKGFAEADPTADVEGIDAANKLCILTALLFDKYIAPSDIPTTGISQITGTDIAAAAEEGCKIKLIAHATLKDGQVSCSVAPEKIPNSHPLAGVSNEFNAVYITGDMVGEVMFYGKGAGKEATASAVVADVIDCVKHLETRKYLDWDEGAPDYVDNAYDEASRLYVRVSSDDFDGLEKQFEAFFPAVTCVKNRFRGEIAFLTDEEKESVIKEKLSHFSNLSSLKVLNTFF